LEILFREIRISFMSFSIPSLVIILVGLNDFPIFQSPAISASVARDEEEEEEEEEDEEGRGTEEEGYRPPPPPPPPPCS